MLLGIETAAERVGVALADATGPRAGTWLDGGRRHAEVLAPAIAFVLDQAGASLADVEAVAVDVGPGLFTGIRAGVATAQGLAHGLGVGVVEVTSVAVLARAAYDAGWVGPVAAVVDGRRGEVFFSRYDGPTAEAAPPRRLPPAALAEELAGRRDLLVVGGGAHRYPEAFRGLRVAGIEHPSPRALVALAADRLAAGCAPVPAGAVRPLYLREPDARINWVQR
jgi:tRNA threonylcarbamoyladenosine biosynthesis protein TsaB